MKILIITPYYKPANIYGGPIVAISLLAEQLVQQHNVVNVWTTNANGATVLDAAPDTEHNVDGVITTYFKLLGPTGMFFSPKMFSALNEKISHFDIVHINTWWNFTALGAALVCRLKGIKPVLTTHGMLSPYSFENRKSFLKQTFHAVLGKKMLQNAYINTTSRQELEECKSIIPKSEGFITSNVVTLNHYPLSEKIRNDDAFKLVFLSRIHPKKGIELLMESLAQVKFRWHLSIVGKGEDNYLKTLHQKVIDLKINDKIEWIPWTDGAEKFDLLSASDLFVLTSFNENFALVVLESLSVGTPVLVSDKVGLSDYVTANHFGWVTTLNVSDITNTLNAAYAQNEVRDNIRNTAAPKVLHDFDPAQVAEQYSKNYKIILEQQNKQLQ